MRISAFSFMVAQSGSQNKSTPVRFRVGLHLGGGDESPTWNFVDPVHAAETSSPQAHENEVTENRTSFQRHSRNSTVNCI